MNHNAFSITFAGLNENACISLASQDWGTDNSSGLISLTIFNSNLTYFNASWSPTDDFNCQGSQNGSGYIVGCPNGSEVPIPIPVALATQICGNCKENEYGCGISLNFR